MDTFTLASTFGFLLILSLTTAQTRTGSTITCSTDRECKEYDLNCDPNVDCTVTCSGTTSCLGAKINGPQSANRLTVICHYDGCRSAQITGPSNGELYIECREHQSCSRFKVFANGGSTYLHILLTQNAVGYAQHNGPFYSGFASSDVYCPISQSPNSCSLRVSGLSSPSVFPILDGIRIFAVNGFNDLNISCQGRDDITECFDTLHPFNVPILLCGSSTDYGCFTAPKTIDVASNSATDWDCNNDTAISHNTLCSSDNGLLPGVHGANFKCDNAAECLFFTFRCRDNTDCYIQCISHYSCQYMTIYGPKNANLNVLCATASVTNNQMVCGQSSIYGPTNGALNIVCNDTLSTSAAQGESTCSGMLVNASYCTHLNITAMSPIYGSGTLESSIIYCPPYVDSCWISVSGRATNILGSLSIYAPNAFYSLSLSCDYAVSVADNCYITEPILYCNLADCSLSIQSGISDWDCSSGSSWIDICNAAEVTLNPTSNPSFIPSFIPTFNPSHYPTVNPSITYMSSSNPTSNPSFNPSFIPTSNPSHYPTVNPTITHVSSSNPTIHSTIQPTKSTIHRDDDNDISNKQKNSFRSILVIVLLLVIISTICCIVVISIAIKKKRREIQTKAAKKVMNDINDNSKDIQSIRVQSISLSSGINIQSVNNGANNKNDVTPGALGVFAMANEGETVIDDAVDVEEGNTKHMAQGDNAVDTISGAMLAQASARAFVNAAVNDDVIVDENDVTIDGTTQQ